MKELGNPIIVEPVGKIIHIHPSSTKCRVSVRSGIQHPRTVRVVFDNTTQSSSPPIGSYIGPVPVRKTSERRNRCAHLSNACTSTSTMTERSSSMGIHFSTIHDQIRRACLAVLTGHARRCVMTHPGGRHSHAHGSMLAKGLCGVGRCHDHGSLDYLLMHAWLVDHWMQLVERWLMHDRLGRHHHLGWGVTTWSHVVKGFEAPIHTVDVLARVVLDKRIVWFARMVSCPVSAERSVKVLLHLVLKGPETVQEAHRSFFVDTFVSCCWATWCCAGDVTGPHGSCERAIFTRKCHGPHESWAQTHFSNKIHNDDTFTGST